MVGTEDYLTTSGFSSMDARPDLSNGRGIGCPWPFSSIVRHRTVYFPAGRPGSRATQRAFVSGRGQRLGRPVAASTWKRVVGSLPSGRSPPHRDGAGRISAAFPDPERGGEGKRGGL